MPPETPKTKHLDPAGEGMSEPTAEVTNSDTKCDIYYRYFNNGVSDAESNDFLQCCSIREIGKESLEIIRFNGKKDKDIIKTMYVEIIPNMSLSSFVRKKPIGTIMVVGEKSEDIIICDQNTYNHKIYNVKSVEDIYKGYEGKTLQESDCYDSRIDINKKIAELDDKIKVSNEELEKNKKAYEACITPATKHLNVLSKIYGKTDSYSSYNSFCDNYLNLINKKFNNIDLAKYDEIIELDAPNYLSISEVNTLYTGKSNEIKKINTGHLEDIANWNVKGHIDDVAKLQETYKVNKQVLDKLSKLKFDNVQDFLNKYKEKCTLDANYQKTRSEYNLLIKLKNKLIDQDYREVQGGIKNVNGVATELEAEFTIHEDTTTSILENDTCFWELYKVNKGETQWPKSGNDKVCKLALLSAPRSPNKALLISPKDLLECSEDTENKQYISFLNYSTEERDKKIYNRFKNNKKLKNTYFYVLGHGSPFTLGMNSTSEVFSVNESGIDNNAKYIKKHFDEIAEDENANSEFSANAWCKKDLKALEALINAKNSPVKPIVFLSCSLGVGINSFAECFSRNLTKPLTVYAANTTVVMGEKGGTYTVSIAGKLKGYTQNKDSYKTKKTIEQVTKQEERSELTEKIAKAGIGHFRMFNYAQRVQVTNSGSGTTTDQTPNGANHP